MNRSHHSPSRVVLAGASLWLGSLALLSGCEEKAPPTPSSGNNPANSNNVNTLSSKGPSNALDRLAEEPTTLAGRSAKTGKNVADQIENNQARASGLADELNGTGEPLTVAGLKWTVPTRWQKKTPANEMRAAEFSIPGDSGDPALLTLSNFGGAGRGGTVQSNIDRWVAQFRNPETGGEPEFKQKKRTVSGMKVELIDIVGTYKDGMPGTAQVTDRQGYAMRGAIIDGPLGFIFVKLTGPYETVLATRDEWYQFIDGMAKK